jgi:hypothetical protein
VRRGPTVFDFGHFRKIFERVSSRETGKEKQEGKRGAASVERRHLSVSEEENKFSLMSFQL